MTSTQFRIADYLFIAGAFALSFYLQQHMFLNWDVGWHLEGAKRMLEGGTYTSNIFDDNPPMVFWFYMPSVLLHHLTSFSFTTLTWFNVTIVIAISFALSNICFNQRAMSHRSHLRVMCYALLLSLLFLPLRSFGQREMLVVYFCFPYIALMGARFSGDIFGCVKNPYFQAFLGVWAAFGVAMNPLYTLLIAALEIQLWFTHRQWHAFRPELMALVATSIVYLSAIAIFYPDYYSVIVPSIFVFSPGFDSHWAKLVNNVSVIYFLLLSICFFCTYRNLKQRAWLLSLWICAVVSYGIYLLNMKLWYYHFYPFIFFATLLSFEGLSGIVHINRKRILHYVAGIVFLSYGCLVIFGIISADRMNIALFKNPKTDTNQVIAYFKKQPSDATFYVFSTNLSAAFSLANSIHQKFISPWPVCWVIPMIASNHQFHTVTGWKKQWIEKYEKNFLETVGHDFKTERPNYVIVDTTKNQRYLRHVSFDFIDFLSHNEAFQQAWKSYRLDTVIKGYVIYINWRSTREASIAREPSASPP